MKATSSRSLAVIAAAACGMLNSGCFVVSSYHVSKPVGPSKTVEFHHPPQGDLWGWYVRHIHSPGVDIDVFVANNAERFQIGFWFWVIPVPYSKSGSPDAAAEINLRPAESGVAIDPWRIEYIPANGFPVGPFKILRLDDGTWKPVSRGRLPINKPESFHIEYRAPCNPDLPFKLSIAGISTSGQTNSIPSIDYQRSKIVRPQFVLPY
jgi:hypothetical protein